MQQHRMAHAGHAGTASLSPVASAPPPCFRGSIIRREDVEFLRRKPETGVLLPLLWSSSCVTRDPAATDSAKPPSRRPEWP